MAADERSASSAPVTGSRGHKGTFSWLGSPIWQGISGLIAVLTLLMTLGLFYLVRELEFRDNTAHLALNTTYRREGPGRWTMIVRIRNRGPGIAKTVHVQYKTIGAAGARVESSPAAVGQLATNASTTTGVELRKVVAADQKDVPGLFIGDFEKSSFLAGTGVYSGTARNLFQGEWLWLEFLFDVDAALDARLLAQVPEDQGEAPPIFREHLRQVTIAGHPIQVIKRPTYTYR